MNDASSTLPERAETTPALALVASPERVEAPPAAHWWRIGDFGVLGLWVAVAGFTLQYHEKWADEAQAWLIARDLPLSRIWFHELRYEGSPGLWHTILWVAQHVFHAKYGALGYIGMAGATAGAALVIFQAPFPRYIRWPLVFTYFLVYQYAVIARPYTLFAFFCLIAALQYRDLQRPGLFALSLVPLSILTAHGSVVAAALALAYAIRFIRQWGEIDAPTRRIFVLAAVLLAMLYLFLFVILLPPADVEATHQDAITGTVFLHRSLGVIGGALVDNGWMSVALLCVLVAWCYQRKALTSFLLPIVLLVLLYIYTAGWPHYQGTVFVTILAGLAIAWPDDEEQEHFDARQLWGYRATIAVLGIVMAYQIYAAATIIRNDVNLPYTGATDAAQFLKPYVAQGKVICGYQYGMVAINAYFDHNIFANRPRAYYHHSVDEFNPAQIPIEISTVHADFIVINWWDPWDENKFRAGLLAPMAGWGYSLAHVSDGYLLTKAGYSHRQIYLVFKRD